MNKRKLVLFLSIALLGACTDNNSSTQHDAATPHSKKSASTHVIVIGAGLSGLNSALMLEQQGFEVTVLEARDRIGGRLYTLDNVPGRPEGGGNIIGPNYARVIDRANQYSLPLLPSPEVVGGMRDMQLFIDGEFIAPRDWGSFSSNPFPQALKNYPPGGMLFGVLRDNPLSEPSDWLKEQYQQYDVPVATKFEPFGLNERSMQLINQTNSSGDNLESTSLLAVYRTFASYAQAGKIAGQPKAIQGGNQRLPEAMAAQLTRPVLTGKVVRSIDIKEDGAIVTTADGSTYEGQYVISSIPLTALRNITITPALPTLQQRAINEIDYVKTLIVQLTVSENYWGQHTPSLWTDTPLERLFATSLDGSGEVTNLTFWLTGDNAMQFSNMPEAERDLALLKHFNAIYPDSNGKVKLEQVVDWNSDPLIQGVWPAYKPGQISLFGQVIAAPHGRLHFAGEHTSLTNTGMEGAMESGERVVAEIIRKQPAANNHNDGKPLFVTCAACHSLAEGEPHKLGPNLYGFYGQAAATRQDYNYTEALQNADIVWDKATLKQWLQIPEKLVPGTRMIYRGTMSDDELNRLITYLEAATSH